MQKELSDKCMFVLFSFIVLVVVWAVISRFGGCSLYGIAYFGSTLFLCFLFFSEGNFAPIVDFGIFFVVLCFEAYFAVNIFENHKVRFGVEIILFAFSVCVFFYLLKSGVVRRVERFIALVDAIYAFVAAIGVLFGLAMLTGELVVCQQIIYYGKVFFFGVCGLKCSSCVEKFKRSSQSG